ncbi:[acyl-carrier-protein] S-malonyltransferase [Pontimonas salivibrio]|uniref:[acyl-carrier-protein] S-malonyltransferase n=1 Tax=Pontimonas salivibrio TaxID=1159327 RepID=A0A2L2BQC6_9MICO|nr:ACP S-malonyltransferase [Pontimonas salivibrio]AVG23873.1 [acyl-carrier-protein] S-malonyltransferase [Pontimonas salivibrio]
MRVVVAPGQGSQKPGFLAPWLENPETHKIVADWSAAIGVDLITHGTHSDAETIRDTRIAQPLIVAAGLISGRALQATLTEDVHYAGHSVGEFTAAALAGVLTDVEALQLVARRGAAMSKAASLTPTGMSAVVGTNLESLEGVLDERGLIAANVNSSTQVVVAGELAALDDLRGNPPEGTRVIPLEVAGAFHTSFMQPAQADLESAATSVSPKDPTSVIYTNQDGSVVTSGGKYLELLVSQMTSPVRWDRCMEAFVAAGATEVIELAPAGALVGLAKRSMPGVSTRKLDLPEHLDAFSAEEKG